jgi:hypothetical protein
MRLTAQGKSGLLYVTEISEALYQQASLLLHLVTGEPVPAQGKSLKVPLDWNIVRLTHIGDEVFVEEPDYTHDAQDFVPGLNFTCAVLHAQQLVHDRLGVGAEPVNYDQGVLAYPNALTATSLVAIRQSSEILEDSGWRVFDAGEIDWSRQPEARRVYEIAPTRPALLGIISLPIGWSVRMEQGILEETVSPEGERLSINMAIQL